MPRFSSQRAVGEREYDENGEVVEAGSGRAGNICIRNPWPGIFQTVWGQPERFNFTDGEPTLARFRSAPGAPAARMNKDGKDRRGTPGHPTTALL